MSPEQSSERRLLKQALAPGKDCLSVEKLELCLDGGPSDELSSHLESCVHCQAELELLRAFHTGPRGVDESNAVREITRRLRAPQALRPAIPRTWWGNFLQVGWLSPVAVGMAALLIVAAVGLEWRHRNAPGIVTPNRAEDDVLRSSSLSLVAPIGDLPSPPAQVQWQSLAGAARYEVRLFEVDQSAVWSASTPDLQAGIPQGVRARMVPAKPFLVQVAAFDSSGNKLAESELVRFRVLPNVYSH